VSGERVSGIRLLINESGSIARGRRIFQATSTACGPDDYHPLVDTRRPIHIFNTSVSTERRLRGLGSVTASGTTTLCVAAIAPSSNAAPTAMKTP
jgi:hypothetical protein